MRKFLLRCPACGRRFVVRLQSKKLVNLEEGTEKITHNITVKDPYGRGFIPGVVYTEDVPTFVESFNVAYECHNCHHKWTEAVTNVE